MFVTFPGVLAKPFNFLGEKPQLSTLPVPSSLCAKVVEHTTVHEDEISEKHNSEGIEALEESRWAR